MENYLDFTNKVVLITGSTRGIGRATAELFARQNATVVINGREKETVAAATEEFRERGKEVMGIAADVSNVREAEAMVEEIIQKFGRMDILVNNAGINVKNQIENINEEEWERIMKVNLGGVFTVTRTVIPHMRNKGGGCIINVSSYAALTSWSFFRGVHYSASKGGIIALTKSLAKEVGKFNIRVNAVMPGLIQTDFTKPILENSELLAKINEAIALRRPGLPKEIAAVCLFLASDMASYVTGEIIPVNGGLTSILFM